MKVFLIGMPQSGRTTVGQALNLPGFKYLHLSSFLNTNNHNSADDYHSSVLDLMKSHPDRFINEYKLHTHDFINNFIVEGLVSPKDFTSLFNYNEDVVVFLNRMDHNPDTRDYQNIAIAIMRDYCFWLSAANLLPKSRWLEFNFKTPGGYDPYIKTMGYKNSVYSVKSLNSVIVNLRKLLTDILEMREPSPENM